MTTPPNYPPPGAPVPHTAPNPADQPIPAAQAGGWNAGPGQTGSWNAGPAQAGSYAPPAGGYAPLPGSQPPPPGYGRTPPGQWPAAGPGYPPPGSGYPPPGPGYQARPAGYAAQPGALQRGLRRGGTILVVRLAIALVVIVLGAIGGFARFHFGHHSPGDVHDAESSTVGQCAEIAGSDSAPVVINLDCDDEDANYKVAVKLSISYASCPAPDYVSVYRPGFKDNFKVCYQLNAHQGECFKQDTDNNYIHTPCTAAAKFKIGQIITGQAESSACGIDADSNNTLVYPQPEPETICLTRPTRFGS